MSQTRQLAAIMFTDIVGYTALMGNDEQKAFELLRRNREIHKSAIEEFGGQWIKELGDGVMASFPLVTNAVYAALRIQEACNQANLFKLRIGIHQGEVLFESGDVFGDAVNIASRIQPLAPPGGIYVSESIYRTISSRNDIRTNFIGLHSLKNVREPVPVYCILTGAEPVEVEKETAVPGSAILPGYDYDIHISYRDNDNKYDNWVTEFRDKLQQELGATLKDRLSIHMDKGGEEARAAKGSPNRSVLFIPIISQTYCDPGSSIWKREFQVFRKDTEQDGLGSIVRLANGNPASRVIPVKIHDIDAEDLRLLESELSGGLRSIDLIYREDGVNRPLRPVDDEKGPSPLRPLYRNQINKLANAIKEIVAGIRAKDAEAKLPAEVQQPTARQIIPNVFTAPVSQAIRVQVIDRQKPSIYLAWTSSDLKDTREEMALILTKAGFNVFPTTDCPADDNIFTGKVQEEMSKCVCSLHMLSGEFGRRFEKDEETSFPQYQFQEARKRVDQPGEEFNVFIWQEPEHSSNIKPAQQQFIRHIRNNITRHMMFSNSQGPMQLVDDIRVVMMKQDAQVFDTKDTDIFFIFNQQDEVEAQVIIDSLSLEYPVETLNILPESEDSYREMSSQQIPKSKLAVVYFKYAADWALPFIKQIWKQVGGASSPTPMFLVGEDDPRTNLARNFKAPKVISIIVPKETIPAEVKKVYRTIA
jgi:class 3 adenylate cyclase